MLLKLISAEDDYLGGFMFADQDANEFLPK
jgi:hypothetical protein